MTRLRLWAWLSLCLLSLVACTTTEQPTALPPTATTAPVSTGSPVSEPVEGGTPGDQYVDAQVSLKAALDAIDRRPGQVLARVNGQEITWEDYEPILRQSIVHLSQRYAVNWQDEAMQQRLQQIQNDALREVVDRWLLRQIAAEQGIAVADAEVDARVAAEQEKVMASGLFEDWQEFLRANGFNDDSFWQLIRDTMLFNVFVAAQDVDPDAEQILLAQIVIGDEAQGQAVLDRLDAGEDFQQVATQMSMDPQTRDKGGEVGWFTPDMMDSEVGRVAFSLEVGEYSGVIGTAHGYTIISVLDRQVRPLDPRVLAQRRQDVVDAQIEAARQAAQIEYLVDFE